MKAQDVRRNKIKEIISREAIGSQEELNKALNKAGFSLTQETLSRDLKIMGIVKTRDRSGRYFYVQDKIDSTQGSSALSIGEVTAEFSGNILVLKTKAGYASGLALDIDNLKSDDIIGTIAGDDTIFAVIKETADRKEIIIELNSLIANLTVIK